VASTEKTNPRPSDLGVVEEQLTPHPLPLGPGKPYLLFRIACAISREVLAFDRATSTNP